MPNLNMLNRTAPGGLGEAEYARIPEVCARFGLSRTGIYRLAGSGRIKLLKLGERTLVDVASVRSYFAALPAAEISPPRNAA